MSTRPRAPAAMPLAGVPIRLATIALVLVAISASLVSSGAVRAEPPPKVTHIEKKDAADPPVAVAPEVVEVNGEALVTVELPPPRPGQEHADASARLLATTPDGSRVAIADAIGHGAAMLTIRQPDGSLVVRDLPGVMAAAFAPDGESLAVLDGHGGLLRLDAATGEGDEVLAGPFSGSLAFEANGGLLTQAVSSVEAPFQSILVRIDLATGQISPLSGNELVLSSTPLADGDVAYVGRLPGAGPAVNRMSEDGTVTRVADLEIAAINVAISPDGHRFAYEVTNRGAFLVASPGAAPIPLADGRSPVFSPDGSKVLLHRGDMSVVFSLDGGVLAELSEPSAAWLACAGEECAPWSR